MLAEFLETRGLTRESGRRRNETGRVFREGLGHTETNLQQHWHSKGLRNLGCQSSHWDPKSCVLDGKRGTGKERAALWLLGALCSLLSCALWALMVPDWLL